MLFQQISLEHNVGRPAAEEMYNLKNQIDHEPQDSPTDGWVVYIGHLSKEIRKKYQADKKGWAIDNTIQIKKV